MRRTAVAIALLMVASSCGGRGEETEPRVATRRVPTTISLPKLVPAVPAFRADLKRPLRDADLRRVGRIPGVRVATPVAMGDVRVRGAKAARQLTVAAVDPLTFRSIAPAGTGAAEFVWTSLIAGEAVVTFRAAEQLHLGRAGVVSVGKWHDLSVGALADNSVPNIAGVLVSRNTGKELQIGRPRVLIVGARSSTAARKLGRALRNRLPGARLTKLVVDTVAPQPAPAPEPTGYAEGEMIGEMAFRILENGFIDPDPAWVEANIARGSVPILGSVTCHRLMFDQLASALAEIEHEGLADLIHTRDYGGCYVPRFIGRDPTRALSMHAFGLAVDLNVSANAQGTRGDMDPRIVAIFEKWGFAWGGYWSEPDPMHFQLARLL